MVRLVVLIVLMLALPLRGLAAAGMPLCHSQAPQEGMAAAHHHADNGEHSHDHGKAHDHGDEAQPHDADDDHRAACSACGASCSAAIAPLGSGLTTALPVSSSAIAFVGTAFSGFTPDVADRPPLL